MKLSIRVKLVALLVAVALLPMAFSLIVMVVGARRILTTSVGNQFAQGALARARWMQQDIVEDMEYLLLAVNHKWIVDALADHDTALDKEELAALDVAWRTMPTTAEPMAHVLTGRLAEELGRMSQSHPYPKEILLTDRFGQLVAAIGRTTDFYQGDEDWWIMAYNKGAGRVVIPPISYDASTGVWSVDICVPIVQGDQVVGVCKLVRDISGWIGAIRQEMGEQQGAAMLVREDGMILFRQDTEPLTTKVGQWYGQIASGIDPGWRITDDGQIQGYATMSMPRRIGRFDVQAPVWSLVLYMPKGPALGPILRLSLSGLAIGILLILVIFLAGLYLVDRLVIRRLSRLSGATRSIAAGDLGHRVEMRSTAGVFVADEIDELADDFNAMVERVQRSHETLTAADQLKMDFIRIAGHELRTPISYILGTVRLLKDCHDPDRLLQAVQMMGAKAHRLDEIIRAMFKLMPEQRYTHELSLETVKISDLLEEVYLDCFPFVQHRSQRLIVEGANRIDSIQADREKLRDIIENLLINAIKFTPDGGTVKLRVNRELGNFASFAVQDQGPGIDEGELPHIFKPFYSGGDVMQHSSGQIGYAKRGMGLGLAIVKHFVELHGGTVTVSSQPHGCVFRVTIPIEGSPAESR